MWQDFKFAVRLLKKDRWFTATAALTLALGIGGNMTVFTIADGMILRGLPVDDPDRIVSLRTADAAGHTLDVSYLDFVDWRDRASSFESIAAHTGTAMNVTDRGQAADRFSGAFVSANTFTLLREKPVLGRSFLPADDRPGAAPVVILGSSVWKGRYGGDAGIIGRVIGVNGVQATVVGVMREGFRFPLVHDMWQPLALMPGVAGAKRDLRTLQVVARLAPRVGMPQAQSELDTIGANLARDFPDTNRQMRPSAEPFTGTIGAGGGFWFDIFVAVAIVLIIACVNVANLLLARSAYRAREISVRTALGASRWRILRQLLVESVLLAALAGVLGLAVGVFGVRLWRISLPEANWPYWYRWDVDHRVFFFAAAVTLGTAVLFGVAPAMSASNANPHDTMKEGERGGTGGRKVRRWTSTLIVVDLALTLALLTGAGLMARTMIAVYRADAVVDPSNIVYGSVALPNAKYPTAAQRITFFERLDTRLSAIPAVAAATLTNALPFYTAPTWQLTIDGRDDAPRAASYVLVGSRYFETLGLSMIRGRAVTDDDAMPGREGAVVNQRLASMYFGNRDPIGSRIRLTNPNNPAAAAPWLTIVGVSPTVRQHYAQEIDPVVYIPYRLDALRASTLLVRARSDAASATSLVRQEMRALDPDLPLYNITPLERLLSGTRFANQVFMTMFTVFAAIAVLISTVGIYSVTSYAVAQRTREIGVRLALGAGRRQVVWLFVRRAVMLLAVGIPIGLAAALAVGRLLRSLLIQTSASDPPTLIAVVVIMATVAVTAAFWPASRAARLDPAAALRRE
jgi:predicted permease